MSGARLALPVVAAFILGVAVGSTLLGHGLAGGADNSGAPRVAAGSALSGSGGPGASIAASPSASPTNSPSITPSPSPTPTAVLVALPMFSVKIAGATSLKYYDV